MTQFPPRQERAEVTLPAPDGRTLKVLKDDVLLSGLSQPGKPVPLHGTRVLTLGDGTDAGLVVYGCNDCEFVGAGRGNVRKHRTEKHGDGKPGTRRRRADDTPEELPLNVPYPDGATVGAEVLRMELGDLLELAGELVHYRKLLENEKARVERWKERATTAEHELRQIKTRLAPFFAPPELEKEED